MQGIHLAKQTFSQGQITSLKANLANKKIIIRICGFAGTGKGTLGENIASVLSWPYVESSMILRAITIVFEDVGLPVNPENTKLVFDKLEVFPSPSKEISLKYNSEVLTKTVLKSEFVDSNVAKYAGAKEVRENYYKVLEIYLKQLDSSCVLDGRGVETPYLQAAQDWGYQIIRLFMDSSDEVKAERYYKAYLQKRLQENSSYQETEVEKTKMLGDFKEGIVRRNEKDLDTWLNLRIGVMTPNTGLLDTTYMAIPEVLQTALNFIQNSI